MNDEAREPMVCALPGFEHVRRSWDRDNNCWMAKVLPGEYYVARPGEGVSTVLGSCVAACVRDPLLGIGGMNHFMLPDDTSRGQSPWLAPDGGMATRYGSHAMECLVRDLLQLGARREHLEFKLFGGGRILPAMTDVGAANVAFAREYVGRHGYRVVAEDLGDVCPRRVVFFPGSGRVLLKRLRRMDGVAIGDRELALLKDLGDGRPGPVAGR